MRYSRRKASALGGIENLAINKVLLKNTSPVGVHWGQNVVQEHPATVAKVWDGFMRLVARGPFRATVVWMHRKRVPTVTSQAATDNAL